MWEVPSKYDNTFFNGYLTMLPVTVIRKVCRDLFVESLDKNSSEFVVMCPRLYYILASSTFQFPAVVPCGGVAYKATSDLEVFRDGTVCIVKRVPLFTCSELMAIVQSLTGSRVQHNSL